MFAAIDLGSNSFRLHIGMHDGESIRIVKSARDPLRLGAGLDDRGFLTPQAIDAARRSLLTFRDMLGQHELEAVRVVATNTLRVAKNPKEFLAVAEKAIGFPIEIISGEEEGRLIYMGVASTLAAPSERRLVIDIGGGSTELILGRGHEIRQVESFSVGTVKQSLSFFPGGRVDANSFEAAILSARSHVEDAAQLFQSEHWNTVYGSSGTIRAIAEVVARNAVGDGTVSLASMEALKNHLIECGHVSKFDLPGIKPERVIVMAGGLAILIGFMKEIGIKTLIAVEAGLRMGVLCDLHLRATRHDRREASIREFLQRFHADPVRAAQVADAASLLYEHLKPASDALNKTLYWSGLLHEIGLVVSHTGFHKHGAYLVENADLAGFTNREQQIMSKLVLAQKGNLRKVQEALAEPDMARAVFALRLATLLLHARVEGQLNGLRVKMKSRIEVELPYAWVSQHPTIQVWLEKERGVWEDVGVPMVVRVGG